MESKSKAKKGEFEVITIKALPLMPTPCRQRVNLSPFFSLRWGKFTTLYRNLMLNENKKFILIYK